VSRAAFLARRLLLASVLAALFPLAACHSYHIDTTIQNRTGADIQLLEVDYPSASFGANRIAANADFHYRFQVRGDGPLKLSFTSASGKQIQATGPTLAEHQQGQLQIVLQPAGKVEFLPQFAPQP
jgi:hypothetical protein